MYSSFSWALQVEASQYLFVWIVIKETGINAPSSASVLEIPGTSSRSDRSSILSCHLIKKMPLSVFSVMLWKTGRNVMLALYLCHKSTFSFCSILRRLVFATLANEFCIVMITECQTSFTFNSSDGISWLSSILSRPEKHFLSAQMSLLSHFGWHTRTSNCFPDKSWKGSWNSGNSRAQKNPVGLQSW